MTGISNSAFYNYFSNLQSVDLPSSVTSIGNNAFASCRSLSSVTLRSGLVSIGTDAFKSCSSLQELTIPGSVASIGSYAFQNSGVTSVVFEEGAIAVGRYAFSGCRQLTRAVLPSTIKTIPYQAFRNCSSLSQVSLAEGLETIEEQAFSNCVKLVGIHLPEGLADVQKGAFQGCTALLRTDVPASVKTIGDSAFQGCISLSSVSFQEGLTQIGASAFRDCSVLRSVALPASVSQDAASVGQYAFRDSGISSVSFAGGALAAAPYIFYNCDRLTQVTLPSTLTTIGNSAFYDCDALEDISFPEGLTGVGESAFQDCGKLVSAVLPEGMTAVPASAFRDCVSLRSLRLPSTITEIGDSAFLNCTSLQSVSVPVEAGILTLGVSAFQNCSSLKRLDLPFSGASTIGSSAFSGCQSLTGVTLRNGPAEIGTKAFYQCYRLNELAFSSSVLRIQASAFQDCNSLAAVSYYGTETDWGYITIGASNIPLTSASRQYRNGEIPVILVDSVSLSETALSLILGDSHTLTAAILPENAREQMILWTSSNPAVASVGQGGSVQALSVGTADVTAASPDGKSAVCRVTVKTIPVSGVTLSKTSLELTTGKVEYLSATVLPENAVDKTVVWTSSNPAVASVDQDGFIRALSAGTADVTARAGGFSAVCRVTVKPIPVSSVTLDKATLELLAGESGVLTATVLPENAGDKTVTWTSSNPSVASVGQDGSVQGLMAGKARVTAAAGGFSASCTVTVRAPIAASIKQSSANSTIVQTTPAPGVSLPPRGAVFAAIPSGDANHLKNVVSGEFNASTGEITFKARLSSGDRIFFLDPDTFIPLAKPAILE